MPQTQLLLAILIPAFTVLVGILLSRNDNAKLDQCLTSLGDRLEARMGGVENRLDGRMNELEGRFHADMLMVIGKLTELEVRVARLEGERK